MRGMMNNPPVVHHHMMGFAPPQQQHQQQHQQQQQQQNLTLPNMNPALNKLNLPPGILKLFEARPPAPFLPPIDKPKMPVYNGVGAFVNFFEDEKPDLPAWKMPESRLRRRERIEHERREKHDNTIREALLTWDPNQDQKATGDPYATLFVSKLVSVSYFF